MLPVSVCHTTDPPPAKPPSNPRHPRNPVLAGEGIHYAAPPPGSVAAFQSIVRSYGLSVTGEMCNLGLSSGGV